MSEPRPSILDIPDEPRRDRRGVPAAAIGAAVCIAMGVVCARTLALGGTVRPWPAVEAVVAVPAMIAAWVLVGPHRQRTWITAGVMVVAVIVQPLAASGATPSPTRLARIVDHLGFPGETRHEVRIGNGRCRPACSELRRVTVVRNQSYVSARADFEGNLRARGFEIRQYGHHAGEAERIDAQNDDYMVQLELRIIGVGVTRVSQVWVARGPTPRHSVG